MATANELLQGDMILTIDPITRTINIPSSIKNLGVESDDEVQKLQFTMPRYYNGIDFRTFDIRINYSNANKEEDVGKVIDIIIDDESISFVWVVERFAFLYAGNVEFTVCLREIDGGGTVLREFNTTTASLPVLVGKETSKAAVEAERDVIAVAADEAIQRALDTELKGDPGYTPVVGTDYYTPEERAEFAALVVNDAKGVFANSLKGSASGGVIRVDDVSPIGHTVKAKVSGKNLLKPELNDEVLGADYNYSWQCTADIADDGKITLTSTVATTSGVAYFRMGTVTLKKGKTYIFSLHNAENIGMYFWWKHLTTRSIGWHTGVPLTPTEDMVIDFAVYMNDISEIGKTASVYVLLEEGNTATEYEPHIDPSTVTVTSCGKNMLPSDALDIANWIRDPTKGHYDYYLTLSPGEYTASFTFKSHGDYNGYLYLYISDDNFATYRVLHQFIASSSVSNIYNFVINKGEKCRLYWFYNGNISPWDVANNFQIEIGNAATEYEIPNQITYTPATDGTVDIVSVAPTMTILSDTEGVVIDVEYSRDLNMVVSEINDTLGSILHYLETL